MEHKSANEFLVSMTCLSTFRTAPSIVHPGKRAVDFFSQSRLATKAKEVTCEHTRRERAGDQPGQSIIFKRDCEAFAGGARGVCHAHDVREMRKSHGEAKVPRSLCGQRVNLKQIRHNVHMRSMKEES